MSWDERHKNNDMVRKLAQELWDRIGHEGEVVVDAVLVFETIDDGMAPGVTTFHSLAGQPWRIVGILTGPLRRALRGTDALTVGEDFDG